MTDDLVPQPQGGALIPWRPGHQRSALIQDPNELADAYEEYEAERISDEEPVDLYSWVGFAERRFGITTRWWGEISRGSKNASKNPELRRVVERINSRIQARLGPDALKGAVNPGVASRILDRMDEREAMAGEAEARSADTDTPEIPPEQIANLTHPDCTLEQITALQKAGIPVPLYTQQLLDLGVPFVMPQLPPPGDDE